MPVETVSLFLGLLTLLTAGIASTSVIVLVGGVGNPAGRFLQPIAAELAAAIATAATIFSLYLSEVQNFEPCFMCWAQRAFMYPAAAVLVASVVTKNRKLTYVGGLLALIGLPVALYHRYEQYAGPDSTFCDPTVPCSSRWLNEFGFVTIPTMAATAFLTIVLLVWVNSRSISD